MTRLFRTTVLALFVAMLSVVAQAQYVPGQQPIIFPTTQYGGSTFTAASATGSTINIAGAGSGVIKTAGTALTTATWQIQGSVDGGLTWFLLPTAAYPTTSVPITTTATSQTSTAAGAYAVNLAGIGSVRFLTTSGTFTATNFTLSLTASAIHGYL